jgi:tRNA dimethylallyltransferase
MTTVDYPAVAVIGPTGSGKSRLGLELAARFRGEIISCDALQIYRHMDIGTAKASGEERRAVAHHMLDLIEPCESFSAGDYQRLGRKAMGDIRSRDRIPFVVGGSGFYLRALIEGLFEGPGRNEALRTRMRGMINRYGARRLHRVLRRVDEESATRIMENDSERVIRALEVFFATRSPMSRWQRKPRETLRGFRWLKLGISWPRETLYDRIDARVEEMIHAGFPEEVRSLLERYSINCQSLKAIGYSQMAEYIAGSCSMQEAVEDTQRASRHYAKRQLTWFRSDPEIIWLDGSDWDALVEEAEARLRRFLQDHA